MIRAKCFLQGAYGPGNFGDDLLLIASLKLVRMVFDEEDIVVAVNDVSAARKMLPRIRIVSKQAYIKCDVAFLGGGGQYFSFRGSLATQKQSDKTLFSRFSNYLAVGQLNPIFAVESFISRLLFKRRWWSVTDVGYGLGVGPFEIENQNYRYARVELPRLEYLSVRDADSKSRSQDLGVTNVRVFTDPIFDAEMWVPRDLNELKVPLAMRNKIGIVIRDWKYGDEVRQSLFDLGRLATSISKEGFEPVFVSFDYQADKALIEFYAKNYSTLCWNCEEQTIEEFLKEFAKFRTVFSARAHGGIVASLLGIPPVLIAIEEKLRQIHKMLPQSSRLIDVSDLGSTELTTKFVQSVLKDVPQLEEGLVNDVRRNEILAIESREEMKDNLINIESSCCR